MNLKSIEKKARPAPYFNMMSAFEKSVCLLKRQSRLMSLLYRTEHFTNFNFAMHQQDCRSNLISRSMEGGEGGK